VLIYPAIDIRGGQCVRLRQGDYAQETVFDPDPVSAARRWAAAGAEWLHLVDLDGAREGRPVNGDAVRRITAVGIACQLGGGLRTDADVELALSWGVSRVILGSRALTDPKWCEAVCRRYPGRVCIGIDARGGKVAAEGWVKGSDISAVSLAQRCSSWPLAAIIHTDISRDGMLRGVNAEATAEVARAADPVPVIASGGVTTLHDIAQCARAGLHGAIVGRALYEGRLDLGEALALARSLSIFTSTTPAAAPAGG
jgi:phosphoribosylformimino-5-aminoimidazole carboxamide ribotide isomerase